MVALEGEELRLHIFGPRYKKLIRECMEHHYTFGIPPVIHEELGLNGAEIQLLKIEKTYPAGEMDIVCKVIQRFEILEVFEAEDKNTAATALVSTLPFANNEDKELNLRLLDLLQQVYNLSETPVLHPVSSGDSIFQYVHKCGLSLEKEEELACLQTASERQLYLLNHLKNLVITMEEIQKMKQLIQRNGHFKKINQSF